MLRADTSITYPGQVQRSPAPLMPPERPEVVAVSPSSDSEEFRRGDAIPNVGHENPVVSPKPGTPARDVVRLYQCRLCGKPFEEPVTLPCGKSICRQCIPVSHPRHNITYPALPDRSQGFRCPFSDCSKEHAVADCNLNVILNKAAHYIREGIEGYKEQAKNSKLSTWISTQDPWQVGGIGSLGESKTYSSIIAGGKLMATWALALAGNLKAETDVVFSDDDIQNASESESLEEEFMSSLKEATRSEMDCQVCYALLYDPLTTGCGHTFCRSCLQRTLDHSRYCPICRARLALNPLLVPNSCPSNESLCRMIETYWWDELKGRKDAVTAEASGRQEGFDTALFVCTLSFPMMPTFLHIFEPRYRLMIRRALEGDRTFGMVLPKRTSGEDERHFEEMGTMLRIINVQFYPDGRSLIETVGLWRFRVLGHGSLDGYTVGSIERIDDVSLEDEETLEAAEVTSEAVAGDQEGGEVDGDKVSIKVQPDDDESDHADDETCQLPSEPESSLPSSAEELDALSTEHLMRCATTFVAQMRAQSAPWLTHRMLAIYGECPDDPAVFPWWFASMLPVREWEKYRLLGTSSVRDRLKMCCSWIIEWETRR